MTTRSLKLRPQNTLFVGIATQKDLLLANGMNCIRNHRRVLQRIRRLMAFVRANGFRVLSICLSNERGRNGNLSFCVPGTPGHQMISYTEPRGLSLVFNATDSTDLSPNVWVHYRHLVVHTRVVDPFKESLIDRVFGTNKYTSTPFRNFVLFGACMETLILRTALGLLQRDRHVKIVVDASGYHDSESAKFDFRKAEIKGARLVLTKQIAGKTNLQSVNVCHCESCRRSGKKVEALVGTPVTWNSQGPEVEKELWQ